MALNLPTAAEVDAMRRGKPISKGKTRLQDVIEARPLTKVTDADFKRQVWERDKKHCRCCGRKVQKVMSLIPERGEVHHIHGRKKDLRFESRCALLVCLKCHERITGKVNDRIFIIATKTIEIGGIQYTDARSPVVFREMR